MILERRKKRLLGRCVQMEMLYELIYKFKNQVIFQKQLAMNRISSEQKIEDFPEELQPVHFSKYSNQSRFDRCPTLVLILLVFVLANIGLFVFLKPFDSQPNQNPDKWSKLAASAITDVKPQQKIQESDKLQSAQIRALDSEQNVEEQKPLDLQPVYIWLGDEVPDRFQKKLNDLKFVYKFRLIRNCDMLLADMEEQLKQKFNPMVYETVNMKSDLCRYIYLYFHGGLYVDLDTDIDLPCLNNFLQGKRMFFEQTPKKTIDIFTIYTAKAYDPEWLKAIRAYNTYNSFFKYYSSYSACTLRMQTSIRQFGKSGCVKHTQERSWIPKK